MKYHIDTIPIWDALHLDGECLLCYLRRRTEHLLADRYLGGSVMESDTRIRVNRSGFCSAHQQMLYDRQNRLGHALMMHSHLMEMQEKAAGILSSARQTAEDTASAPALKRLMGRGAAANGLKTAAADLAKLVNACTLCDSLDDTMNRYVYTVLHLWKTDASFRKALTESKGFCLKDAAHLLDMASDTLRGKHLSSFLEALEKLMNDSLARNEKDLEWFTLKFDYRNAAEPWRDSRDALERTVQKLRGCYIGTDPAKDK